jgi:hypothetical protein
MYPGIGRTALTDGLPLELSIAVIRARPKPDARWQEWAVNREEYFT